MLGIDDPACFRASVAEGRVIGERDGGYAPEARAR